MAKLYSNVDFACLQSWFQGLGSNTSSLIFISCATMSNLINPVSCFPICKRIMLIENSPLWLLWGLNGLVHKKHLEECLAHGRSQMTFFSSSTFYQIANLMSILIVLVKSSRRSLKRQSAKRMTILRILRKARKNPCRVMLGWKAYTRLL